MMLIPTFITTLAVIGASASPLASDGAQVPPNANSYPQRVGGPGAVRDKTEKRDALRERCSWNDGIGEVACDQFTVWFNHNGGNMGKDKQDVTIKGNGWEKNYRLACSGSVGDNWNSFTSPLPMTVDIRGGNACGAGGYGTLNGNAYDSRYDNTWIKYTGYKVDVPTDARCGPIFENGRRCVIPI